MDREGIFLTLRNLQTELADRGVNSLAVFGSFARGDFSPESDLDLLVDFNRPIGLFEFIRLKLFLEKATGCRVDLVTPDALHPALRDQILGEAVYVREKRGPELEIARNGYLELYYKNSGIYIRNDF